MSLDLDKRQRAMLREMGIRVWQPMAEPAPLPVSPAAEARSAEPMQDESLPPVVMAAIAPAPAVRPPVEPPVKAERAAPVPAPAPAASHVSGQSAAWALGAAQPLYAQQSAAAASQERPAARWLVLVETPASLAAEFAADPFSGEAGKLLDNMLRAARLHQGDRAFVAPVTRLSPAAVPEQGLTHLLSALDELMREIKPDVLLIMGRLTAQALLQSSEPLSRLRGQVHDLHGAPAIVTYDAGYLLRSLPDKAKAWDDLCVALAVVKK
jgi:uracil-DNA glycosylase family 4